jgi:hypothetical protein
VNKVIALLFAGLLAVGMTACDNRQSYDDDDDRRQGVEREYDDDRDDEDDD